MKNTFAISFFAKYGKENQDGQTPIYCRITLNGERAELATHYYIKRKQWETFQENPATRKSEFEKLKEMIETHRSRIRDKYHEMINNSEVVSANTIKLKFLGKLEERKRLIDVAAYYCKMKNSMVGNGIEATTAEKFLTTKKYLQEFLQKHHGKQDVALCDIKPEFMTNFKIYLLTFKNIRNNSMVNHLTPIGTSAFTGGVQPFMNE